MIHHATKGTSFLPKSLIELAILLEITSQSLVGALNFLDRIYFLAGLCICIKNMGKPNRKTTIEVDSVLLSYSVVH